MNTVPWAGRIVFFAVPACVSAAAVVDQKPPPAAESAPAAKGTDRGRLERQIQEQLTGATLEGIWQMTGEGGLAATSPLSEPRPERYAIANVVKAADDYWVINARIQYGDKDVTVPVTVRVVWAGDTPVITLDDLAIPMIGTYSCRVIIHRNFYSGTWLSNEGNYGGILAGRIMKPGQTPPPSGGGAHQADE